jgi:rhodanese-related sulfurtransferase
MTNLQIFPAEKLNQIDLNDGIIIDVRSGMEHDEKRLTFGHTHIPLEDLKPNDLMMRHGLDKDTNVYLLCRSGKRATVAAEKFLADGYRNVHVIEGGLIACESCGQGIEGHGANGNAPTAPTAKAHLSLERQVRIAAGSLAAVGALLGIIATPLFTVIPLFVGIGLVFAGITDRCGIALTLTKAPWNKKTASQTSCCASKTACTMPSKSAPPTGAPRGKSCQ